MTNSRRLITASTRQVFVRDITQSLASLAYASGCRSLGLLEVARMAEAKQTTDHETIRKWVEARGGKPSRVKGTGSHNTLGVLRIDYEGYSGEDTLEEISWAEFFDAFEANDLAFLYQDEDDSRFSKFIARHEGAGRGKSA